MNFYKQSIKLFKFFFVYFLLISAYGISICAAQSNEENLGILAPSVENNDADNNKLKHWLTIGKKIELIEKFKSDSLLYTNLNKLLIEKEAYISESLKMKGINTSKDPFETTASYQMRMGKINQYKDSLINVYITPISNQIHDLKEKIYQNNFISNSKLQLDLSNYNADNNIWKLNMFHENKINVVLLNIIPTNAKILWENKNNVSIYNLKKINGELSDILLIQFDSSKQNILIKNVDENNIDESIEIIYTKVEIEAEFPGGSSSWFRYFQREIERNIDEIQDDGKSGIATVLFIVDKEGNVSDVKAVECSLIGTENCLGSDTKLAKVAVDAIKKGPKWKPAIQNGRQVKSYKRQTVEFKLEK